jgi:hypothetical protein
MSLSERMKKLLLGGEGVDVEYKTNITQEFNETLVAFANGNGGICLFGVEDNKDSSGKHVGKVVGIEISDRTRGRIQSRADQTIDKIEIAIESEVNEEGKGIYVVTIQEGKNKPYCTGGGRYIIRRDGQNAAISPTMMERIIEHRIDTSPAAQPILRLITNEVQIHPPIELKSGIGKTEIALDDRTRHTINFPVKIVNIGSIPAQSIVVDAEVRFKKRRPLNYKSLPTHLYQFVEFLSPESTSKERSEIDVNLSFDNFVAKQIILDFFEGRKNYRGFPDMPSTKELHNLKIWPSPAFNIRCLYSDTHGQNYCSEIQRFVHIWRDTKKNSLGIYFMSLGEVGFKGVKKIDQVYKENYNYQKRNLRYSGFHGKKYKDGELILLRAVRKK